jgi:hypothetical protein
MNSSSLLCDNRRLSIEVVTTAKGQHLNVTVTLVPPPGTEFPADHTRRSNPVVEILHKDNTNTSINAWRREDVKVAFGWRTFDASNRWRHTVLPPLALSLAGFWAHRFANAQMENVLTLRAASEQYLVKDTLIVRFKFNEYERGSVESWIDDSTASRKPKERLNGYAACTYKNGNQVCVVGLRCGFTFAGLSCVLVCGVGCLGCGESSMWVVGCAGVSLARASSRTLDRSANMWGSLQTASEVAEASSRSVTARATSDGGGRGSSTAQANGSLHSTSQCCLHVYVWTLSPVFGDACSDGGSVEGDWVDGKLVRGRGQFLNFETGSQYVGQFGPGLKRHGEGTLTALDGTKISGRWVDNVLTDGHGTRVLENGATYTGRFFVVLGRFVELWSCLTFSHLLFVRVCR